jgi:hypothetical protein
MDSICNLESNNKLCEELKKKFSKDVVKIEVFQQEENFFNSNFGIGGYVFCGYHSIFNLFLKLIGILFIFLKL